MPSLSIALPHGRLAAQVWGDDRAPPLLALHGWLDNAGSYARLAPLLAARWRFIALELPGHGHSDHLPAGTDYHFVDYVSRVLAAADALGLKRYSLLGHSLGAGIAALVAAAAPERIRRLCLIEGLGPAADDGTRTLQRFRNGMLPGGDPSRPLRVFPEIDLAIKARVHASGLRAELARPIVERGLIETEGGWRWRSDPRLTRTTPLRLAESQVRTLLAGIAAPTAVLLAKPETPYLPDATMHERAACVADIRLDYLDGGHHLHLEHPAAAAAWIERQHA